MGSIVSVDTLQGLTSGQVTLPTGHKIKGTDVGSIVAPGTTIQVVQGVLADPATFATAAWVDTGITVTITPKFATSKILIQAVVQVGGDASSYDAGMALVRNGTHIALPNNYGSRMGCFMPMCQRNMSQYETASVTGSYLDSPATTSALTYKLQVYCNSSTTQYINRSSSDSNLYQDPRHISTITVMEIAQ